MKKNEKKGITIIEKWLSEMGDSVTCNSDNNEIDNKKNKDLIPGSHYLIPSQLFTSQNTFIFQDGESMNCFYFMKSGGIPNFQIGASKRVDKQDFKKWIISKK